MRSAAEATYFDGAYLAHVAARDEHLRLKRIRRENQRAIRDCAAASRRWEAMADRLAADHREFRARLTALSGALA